MKTVVVLAPLLALAGCLHADPAVPASTPGYPELRESPVRGLSPEEIDGLLAGSGMGFALPAELNGVPGPKHVLEHADALGLGDAQLTEIERLRAEVVAEAARLGAEVVRLHEGLERGFRDRTHDEAGLRAAIDALDAAYADVRYAHLAAHLATMDVLTPHQVALYGELRGYGAADHTGHGHG